MVDPKLRADQDAPVFNPERQTGYAGPGMDLLPCYFCQGEPLYHEGILKPEPCPVCGMRECPVPELQEPT